jgi:metal-responsive CopG/Arc/MetJ family transcriptional regulator
MVDTKAVSVRLPLDLLNELNSYATDKGMVRGGDANIGGAIIAVLREHFGQSDNVKQVSDSVDIESIVNDAVESRLEAVLSQVENLRLDVHSVKTDDLLYENLRTNLTVLQGKVEILETRTEATAPAKKLKIVA